MAGVILVFTPGFDLPRRSWSLLKFISGHVKATVYTTYKNGVSLHQSSVCVCVCVASSGPCIIWSTRVNHEVRRLDAFPTWSRWWRNPLAGVYRGYITRQIKLSKIWRMQNSAKQSPTLRLNQPTWAVSLLMPVGFVPRLFVPKSKTSIQWRHQRNDDCVLYVL